MPRGVPEWQPRGKERLDATFGIGLARMARVVVLRDNQRNCAGNQASGEHNHIPRHFTSSVRAPSKREQHILYHFINNIENSAQRMCVSQT